MFLRGIRGTKLQRSGRCVPALLHHMGQFMGHGLRVTTATLGIDAFGEKNVGTDREGTGVQRTADRVGLCIGMDMNITHVPAEFLGVKLVLPVRQTLTASAHGLNFRGYIVRQHTAFRTIDFRKIPLYSLLLDCLRFDNLPLYRRCRFYGFNLLFFFFRKFTHFSVFP